MQDKHHSAVKPELRNYIDEQVQDAVRQAKLTEQLPYGLRETPGERARHKLSSTLCRLCVVGSACSFGIAVLFGEELFYFMKVALVAGVAAFLFKVDAALVESKQHRRQDLLKKLGASQCRDDLVGNFTPRKVTEPPRGAQAVRPTLPPPDAGSRRPGESYENYRARTRTWPSPGPIPTPTFKVSAAGTAYPPDYSVYPNLGD